jgi:beta-glucoside operon transcriptional antiterminator
MIIEKILNNNVLLTRNEKGKEVIVMGRGISFNKSIGDTVEPGEIDKIFTSSQHLLTANLADLLSEIPAEQLELSKDIVEHANYILGTTLSESIYLTLTDHIHFALQRHQEGLTLKNAMLFEIKRFYKKEFMIALDALNLIEEKTSFKLGEDEAGFIALHLVNARKDGNEMKQTMAMTEMVRSILNIVTYHFGIVLDESTLSYSRFLTHLQYFSMRMLRNEVHRGVDDFLYDQVKNTYTEAYACVVKINEFLEKTYGQSLSKDEYIYLTIHIHRITDRNYTI